jgi:murein tripeptide amidase MpaA
MQIDSNFECGNILVQGVSSDEAVLNIRPDTNAQFFQWFYFHVTAGYGNLHHFRIANASKASYPNAWNGYRALASYDEKRWFRVHTEYNGAELLIRHRPMQEAASYAFFVPYKEALRKKLLRAAKKSPHVTHRKIGKSVQGRPLDLLVFGDEKRMTKRVWIIARQHAGESMAEYCVDGMVRHLIDANDPIAQTFLSRATVYIVPNMNPDGSAVGNLRANANGVDLNRAWVNPPETAPEIQLVRGLMDETGVDVFLDVHGDEERHYLWLAHPHPSNISKNVAHIQRQFEEIVQQRFTEYGPTPASIPAPSKPDSGMATDYVAGKHHCPAWIIELPNKDTISATGEHDSLLAAGCANFGRAAIDILCSLI